jgi:hypothetical protein
VEHFYGRSATELWEQIKRRAEKASAPTAISARM